MPTKVITTGPSGEAFVNNTAVSLVSYHTCCHKYTDDMRASKCNTCAGVVCMSHVCCALTVTVTLTVFVQVRYSHGGHLMVAVTGRLAQIFNLYDMDFQADITGAYTRLMVMSGTLLSRWISLTGYLLHHTV